MGTSAPDPNEGDPNRVAQEANAAAVDAATAGETPEQARERVADAVRTEASAQGVRLTDEDVDRISEATIEKLDARGAFEHVPPAAAPAQPSAEGNAPAEGSAQPAQPGTEEAPRKPSLAEKFMGINR